MNPRFQEAAHYAGGVKPLPEQDLEHVLTHTAPLWESARGAHIFITGGTGFFGSWLLESFARCNEVLGLNAQATVLTRNPERFGAKSPHLAKQSSIKLLQGDVRSCDLPSEQFEFVINAAAPTSADAAAQPRDLMRTIVEGTDRVVQLAEQSGTKRFLLASSGAVYGRQPHNLSHIQEDYLGGPDWLDPKSAYAEGKRVAEQICAASARESDVRFGIARGFAFVGPYLPLDQHFAIGNFIRDALAGRKITIRGDGTPTRSYLYAADLAIWLWTMLLRDSGAQGSPLILNVGSGEAISIGDLARMVAEELDPSLQIQIARQAEPGQQRERYVPDVRKAESCLGLRQTIGLREAIRRTAAWYRGAS
jgi:nucleoside-diphosphate-sugar epimerase